MKRFIALAALFSIIVSCKDEKDKVGEKVAEVPVADVEIQRFDKIFFESGPENLPEMKEQFPYLFPQGNTDAVWLERMNDPFLKKLYDEVQKEYPDTKALETDLQSLFRHIKYYYPDESVPEVVTLVSDDLEVKSVYADGLVLIPLSLYLGSDNYLYEGLDRYQAQGFNRSQILPDIVESFSQGRIAPPKDRSLLSLMIFHGKALYLKDVLLPDAPDKDKMGYTEEQIKWVQDNEADMWRYFIDEKLLYSTDARLPGRFINPAPFSKFYLEVDNESPGRTGQWLGWQIVRAYMQNNKDVTLQELLEKDANEIFNNSKYKPKKK